MRTARAIGVAVALLAGAGCVTLSQWFPAELRLTWLGASGWSIADGEHLVLVDPYLAPAVGPIPSAGPAPVPDPVAVASHLPAHVDLILVGRPHPDQALDAAGVARRTGALLAGSQRTIDAARAQAVPEAQLRVLHGGDRLERPGISVQVIPGAGSGEREAVGFLVTLKDTRVLVFDSPDFVEKEVEGLRPHAAILGSALSARPQGYACRLMNALGAPRVVLPTHVEDWLAPALPSEDLDGKPELLRFVEEIHACAPWTRVVDPRVFEPVVLRN